MTFVKDEKEMRAVYAEALIKLAEADDRICICEADLMNANGTKAFAAKFPERTFNVGIAEANMIGVAAGLAACGKMPFANTFTAFATRRCLDQIIISCAYTKLPVRIGGTDPGICAQLNGGTHMSLEDMALMRGIPGMTVYEAVDAAQLAQAVPAIAAVSGPAYLRINRTQAETVFDKDYTFKLGRADVLRDGRDAVILCTGIMVWRSLAAAGILADEGIDAAVVNVHTLKPLDTETIAHFANKTGAVVTAENHSVVGALGSAVAEVLSESCPVPLRRIGVQDRFGEVGLLPYLAETFGMTEKHIAAAVKQSIGMKSR